MLGFSFSQIAEIEFLNPPVKIGSGFSSVKGFQMAEFLIYESRQRD